MCNAIFSIRMFKNNIQNIIQAVHSTLYILIKDMKLFSFLFRFLDKNRKLTFYPLYDYAKHL